MIFGGGVWVGGGVFWGVGGVVLGVPATIPLLPALLTILLMLTAAMLGCGFLGVAIEWFAYRPLRNAPRIAPLISALGMSILLENAVQLTLTAQYRVYRTEQLIPISAGLDLGPAHLSAVQ